MDPPPGPGPREEAPPRPPLPPSISSHPRRAMTPSSSTNPFFQRLSASFKGIRDNAQVRVARSLARSPVPSCPREIGSGRHHPPRALASRFGAPLVPAPARLAVAAMIAVVSGLVNIEHRMPGASSLLGIGRRIPFRGQLAAIDLPLAEPLVILPTAQATAQAIFERRPSTGGADGAPAGATGAPGGSGPGAGAERPARGRGERMSPPRAPGAGSHRRSAPAVAASPFICHLSNV